MKPKSLYTIEQYLAMERAAPERNIFVDGEIIALPWEGGAHADISVNLVALIGSQLWHKPHQARTKLTKLFSGPSRASGQKRGMFSYPDVLVISGEPEHFDADKDVILNPAAVFEVLSKRTEAFDRGEQFVRCQLWNPTFSEYVLVSQDRPQIEHFIRQDDTRWSYQLYSNWNASIQIASIGCVLCMAEVYERVPFAKD